MYLSADIITILLLDIMFVLFCLMAFWLSIKIFIYWDIDQTTQRQYKLEKQSYLVSTIIKYVFMLKIPLFLFFIFTLDKMSSVITGAMCAAGVVDATIYGTYLLILKILNIYLFGFWLVLHDTDSKLEIPAYTKTKSLFFIIVFVLFVAEVTLEILMFGAIDTTKLVNCCGALYSSTSTSFISIVFSVDISLLLEAYTVVVLAIAGSYLAKQRQLFALLNILFLIFSIVLLIVFFGTYIYELPTHHCPFCLLQKDYNYVGFVLYILLFMGTFNGILVAFNNEQKRYLLSLLFNLLYLGLVSYYPIAYYFKNGVWL